MKTIKTLVSAIGVSTLLSASALASDVSSKFTVAIIKNAAGSNEIIKGDYHNGIESLSMSDTKSSFDESMGLCVAYLQANSLADAEVACTDAITAIDTSKVKSHRSQLLKALAYSNRGIVKYFKADEYGALEDLSTALLLADDPVIINNINYLKSTASTISYDENDVLIASE
ncbi:hypothetical protein [Thalassotalea profundi]|uniref:Tetratricopeptide repeat protein n=1 Tax=Thalassotalea profundi TaxID=2036687 RepID=A0ABQ3IQ95_9GAMM|nr:hypothetical protein [Thalassotalea profundi]GHE86367.1 hypothetical protein GCM10011501_14400 [Thalassotalea profundi]